MFNHRGAEYHPCPSPLETPHGRQHERRRRSEGRQLRSNPGQEGLYKPLRTIEE